ncbi:cytochrome P450 89A2 isoform X2 [Manihot esculenta]|nr:cytochrome P450 89A2 isoform X2 [Manihot esculenta]
MNHLQHAMFCLLAVMCLGDKVGEDDIEKIEVAHRRFLSNFVGFNIFSFCPSVTMVVFRNIWKKYLQIRQDQENTLIPLIRARKELKEEGLSKIKEGEFVLCYVDSLIDLQLPVEKRKLEEGEIVSLCSEFLSGGAETTTTALQWIMANLVKYPQIQEKLFRKIKEVVGEGEELIKEEDLQKMPYLKAVILEGLRRHPPAHMVVPHVVTEDTVIDKYLVPKNGTINFMVAEMGRDPKVWEDPMEFKPERFMSCDGEMVDVTGVKEIKMMPFGSGRRICPGYSLAMFHLEYFVANLVWSYEWKKLKGDEVDLSEQLEFSVGMQYPLQACISPRSIQMSTTSSVPDGFIFNKLHLS